MGSNTYFLGRGRIVVALAAEKLEELKEKAARIRYDIISMIGEAGSGHPGGSLSIVELLTALYGYILNVDPRNPQKLERDRLILSKGHAAPALYAVLAAYGFFPCSELRNFRRLGSPLQGHPGMRKLPGIEISTGSLGQGLSVANGMALAAKLNAESWRVFVILGDGEIQEGQIWEAAMTAAHYRLDNVIAFLDYNRLQIDGSTSEVMSLGSPAEKWRAFGWDVTEIDGHNFQEIIDAVERTRQSKGRPSMIIAHTVKGKGVSFMENEASWHGTAPDAKQLKAALAELTGFQKEEHRDE